MDSQYKDTDIIIVGGGITGLTMACALGTAGIHTAIIDQKPLKATISNHTLIDGRCYAIAYGSSLILQEAGIWPYVIEHISPILDIRVSDQASSFFLHYDHQLVGDKPLGYMIAAEHLHYAAFQTLEQNPFIALYSPQTITHIEYAPAHVTVTLNNGQMIRGKLLIGADGKSSKLRQNANIDTITHDYQQTGIVCTIQHEAHHQHLAQERFLSTGPFAALPLKGGHHSSLVWVERTELAPLYLTMSEAECVKHIQTRIGNYLGNISIVSPRFSYPLILVHAKKYYAHRLALIGDAAHGIHPLAGQGLNLSIRDVGILTKLITAQAELGLDIGSVTVLNEYNAVRKFDSWSLIAITHGLNRLFASNRFSIKLARRLGMSIVQRLPTVKAKLMRHAMGI
jgi:2-octaprenyl-6-methoxyphenol hydroxylase